MIIVLKILLCSMNCLSFLFVVVPGVIHWYFHISALQAHDSIVLLDHLLLSGPMWLVQARDVWHFQTRKFNFPFQAFLCCFPLVSLTVIGQVWEGWLLYSSRSLSNYDVQSWLRNWWWACGRSEKWTIVILYHRKFEVICFTE